MARRVSHSRGRKRQRVEWSGSFMDDLVLMGGNNIQAIRASPGLLQAVEDMTSPTLVRTRGDFVVQTSGGANNDDVIVGAGVGVFSTRAAQVGVTALPRPITDLNWSWLWHHLVVIRRLATTDNATAVMANNRVSIDSRAMRKIANEEEEIVSVIQTISSLGSAQVNFAISIRVLLKEG